MKFTLFSYKSFSNRFMRTLALFTVLLIVSISAGACVDTSNKNPFVTVVMDETSNAGIKGTFVIELYPDIAPNTVNYFIQLINNGTYNSFPVSKTMANSMVQFGDPWNLKNISTVIDGEFTENGFENNLKFQRGVVGMSVLSGDNYSATGDFFIVLEETLEDFDGKYAAFGKVISGIEVVEEISNIKSSYVYGYEPFESQRTKTVTVDLKGRTYPPAITKERTRW